MWTQEKGCWANVAYGVFVQLCTTTYRHACCVELYCSVWANTYAIHPLRCMMYIITLSSLNLMYLIIQVHFYVWCISWRIPSYRHIDNLILTPSPTLTLLTGGAYLPPPPPPPPPGWGGAANPPPPPPPPGGPHPPPPPPHPDGEWGPETPHLDLPPF